MSVATGLIAKILIALSVIPTAGYGGYCAYDHCYPTFHNQLINQGWVWSPISGDMKINESLGSNIKETFKNVGGDWRCTKQLFSGLATPSTDTSKADKGASKNGGSDYEGHETPSKTTVNANEWEEGKSVGCLVADLGYAPNKKRNGFIKWELALKNKDRGFIYVGYMSFGATKNLREGQTAETLAQVSTNSAFEVKKDQENWRIGKGFVWSDSLIDGIHSNDTNGKINVTLPNEHKWETEGKACTDEDCTNSQNWIFQKWVGFWEEKNSGDKQPTDALDIQIGKENTKEHKHDIWQTSDFDFKTSNQITEGKAAWSSTIGYWYDDTESKWKEAKVSQGDNGYLEEIYKPWAKKKGTWMEAEGLCSQSSSRSLKETEGEGQRLLNFCYQKQGTEINA